MHILTQYKDNIVKYDLINTFNYKLSTKLPKIEHITLTFKLKRPNFKMLNSAMVTLTLLTSQKSKLTQSKVSNISLKIRKGQPVGCKVTLRKKKMNIFMFKILNKIILNELFKTTKSNNLFSLNIQNVLIFSELEKNYQFFKDLPCLNIYIKTTNCTFNELKYLINSYKIVI